MNKVSQEREQFLKQLKRMGPEEASFWYVRQFLDCFAADCYPQEDYERVFGVVKGNLVFSSLAEFGIGNVTFNAWKSILLAKYTNETEMRQALLNGDLPGYFEKKLRLIMKTYKYPGGYVPELFKRGLDKIPWDLEAHELFKRKGKRWFMLGQKIVFPTGLVSGIRIDGDQIYPEQIKMDSTFEKCPIALACGIPLYVKRLEHLESPKPRHINLIVRLMSETSTGLAPPRWAYGGFGNLGPAPPVLLARSDSIPFEIKDWSIFDEFESSLFGDGGRNVTREDFIKYAKGHFEDPRHFDSNLVLEVVFPKGQRAQIVELQTEIDLNDKVGEMNGQYRNGRVGIKIDGSDRIVAVKPGNLRLQRV